MRRLLLTLSTLLAALPAVWAGSPDPAAAQAQPRPGPTGSQQDDDRARRERQRRDFEAPQARLPGERNAGPCPFVKVLYDAGRYVEFAGGRESPGAAAFTGEIQGVEAECRYREAEPIRVNVDVLFALGRGPRGQAETKQYRWWAAVTERNRAVLTKEYFALNAQFPAGADRIAVRERLGEIVIPRASQTVSGSNFEILVGFDVTPEMAAFNRDGKRFRPNAGQTPSARPPAQGQTPGT